MYSLLPIYKFEFETRLSQRQVVHHLNSLLKREENSKKKFEIHINGSDWGTEDFKGIIKDDHFKLKRYRYLNNDHLKCFVYSGKIKPLNHGCLIQCVFRFDFETILFLVVLLIAIWSYIMTQVKSDTIAMAVITAIVMYISLNLGFNYRINKVKVLLEKKLNKINNSTC